VEEIDPRQVLWANVHALMNHHWKGENLSRLSRDARIGPGTCTRMKEQRTSVGIEIVGAVGRVFGLEAWQLLVPGLDPKSPPVLILSESERDFYRRVLNATRDFKDADT